MKMKKLLIPLFLCCAVTLQAQPEVRPGNETPKSETTTFAAF